MKGAILRALGCDPRLTFEAALASLQSKPALLVLDNLETPWEPLGERAATEAVLAILGAVPGLSLLASMRRQEWIKHPGWRPYSVPPLAPSDADRLFAAIAGEWALADPLLGEFREILGGLPLAIELADRRTYGRVSLVPLRNEWNRIGAELAQHPDFAKERLTSLPHSIELSLRSPRMRSSALRLFRLLGFLPAGLSEEDLITLMGGSARSNTSAASPPDTTSSPETTKASYSSAPRSNGLLKVNRS